MQLPHLRIHDREFEDRLGIQIQFGREANLPRLLVKADDSQREFILAEFLDLRLRHFGGRVRVLLFLRARRRGHPKPRSSSKKDAKQDK